MLRIRDVGDVSLLAAGGSTVSHSIGSRGLVDPPAGGSAEQCADGGLRQGAFFWCISFCLICRLFDVTRENRGLLTVPKVWGLKPLSIRNLWRCLMSAFRMCLHLDLNYSRSIHFILVFSNYYK